MTLQEFITLNAGKYVNFNPRTGFKQCMDLFRVYVRDVLGDDYQPKPVRNAAAVWNNYPERYWIKVFNNVANFPQPGDVVIWSKWKSPSLTGHIAICVEADVNRMTCFSQNDPGGTCAMLREYDYTRVLGWLRPIIPVPVGACNA